METGAGQVDQILAVLLGSSLFVGSLVAVVTDNTLPGLKNFLKVVFDIS